MKRVCTICARGGSKGVKGKNVRMLLGRPLLEYTIEQAQRSNLFSCIAVSSDSAEILKIARDLKVDVLVERPAEMATDSAGKVPAIKHCAQQAEARTSQQFDVIVDMDATSPLRLIEDIRGAVHLLESTGAPNVITGAPARRSPYFNLVEEKNDGSVSLSKTPDKPILRRQDAPKCYDMNASIYVWTRETLFEKEGLFQPGTRLFEMPEERSQDIDSELDFLIVEMISKQKDRFKNVW